MEAHLRQKGLCEAIVYEYMHLYPVEVLYRPGAVITHGVHQCIQTGLVLPLGAQVCVRFIPGHTIEPPHCLQCVCLHRPEGEGHEGWTYFRPLGVHGLRVAPAEL